MALGLAGGFLLRPVVLTEHGEFRLFAEQGEMGAAAAGSEALAGKSEVRSSGKRSAGSPLVRLSSGDAVTDVRDLIASFEGIRSETQLNPMELIRRLYLLTQLRESEVLDVLASLSNAEDRIGGPEFGTMAGMIALTRLAELNGPEAMRLIHSKELASMWDGSAEDAASVMVMHSWVAADPEGAKRWFDAAMKPLARETGDDSDSDKRDQMMIALVRSAKDPAELVGLLDRCTAESDARTEAIEKLNKSDPRAAAAWVEKQSVDEARDEDIANVATAMMERDSEKGVEWYLAQELADEEREGERLSRIVGHLASTDLEQAAEWVESRSDDDVRDSAEIEMAKHCMRKDADQGMAWLNRVGDPERRDLALQGILEGEWDYRQARLRDGVIEAAERAGMGEAARNFNPD